MTITAAGTALASAQQMLETELLTTSADIVAMQGRINAFRAGFNASIDELIADLDTLRTSRVDAIVAAIGGEEKP